MKRCLFALLFCCATLVNAATPLIERPEVQSFINEMVKQHDFKKQDLQALFEQTKSVDSIIEAMERPYEAKPWYKYRQLFVTDKHAKDGAKFWAEHKDTLARAEKQFGVPAQIIVAIIGVETRYGRNQGSHLVMDALSTLAFDYPPRAKFFKSELEEFLLLSREQGFDPLAIKGSYAGAMGTPQFISSSYRHYAVDFTGDGKSDLLNNKADAIGSVANYFKVHGWTKGEGVVFPAQVKGEEYKSVIASRSNPKPKHRLAEFKTLGIIAKAPIKKQDEVALIELEQDNGPEYWVGLNNFYVITRYNHSNLYAMAVYQLSEKIKSAYHS